ncbi:mitochondrial coenzyme A transporter SLC25A42 [Sitophilus oryzae]|uniref:Mitochondrial coenzyme A transporter SLC25A42 n=1 Tax=Sitophilus oryzae TaxID=7048 RepID=A0A6J2X6I9_SITOR|nr:mitochondrial coenzyme A transporter SLC25A42 [Sitophilus oryzae]XP_030746779.1 mitochondrial coenzyme A transporter SLC25A42 [Sitophilus oryzae]XP_030746780.1 mitochondrial coenzyme A transporter SLC25A42 [Sitophilus oryzae]XP_030746781.1 mitochondrial coenzyme A transporter SLC25A42 [Sitophilus oryzae]XP_030746782.1 mitochondrial coenzyme A transporter SLC25A42 [Sitophilus oryzae]
MGKSNQNVDPKLKHLSNGEIVVTSLAAGAIAGALAKTTIAPLDRTKINFQISHKAYSTRKAFKFLAETFKKQGPLALWRGNSATMARIVPYCAIQFTAHEQWKRILKVEQNQGSERLFLAGSLAGVTSQALTYPLDLARARMAVTNKLEYSTLRHVFSKIYSLEGVRAFFKGFIPTIVGVIPYAGVSFFTYDTLKRKYGEHMDTTYIIHPVASLFFGAIAGVLGQTSSYPFDIIRRRMQTDTTGKYPNMYHTLLYVYKTEGIRKGFYKGLSMNWIKGPIAVGISYSTYDNIRDMLRTFVVKFKKESLV